MLNSILNLADVALIIVDYGSCDGTVEFLNGLSSDTNIVVYGLKENKGLNSLRKLFNTVVGEYLIVVDDDVLEFPFGIDELFEKYMMIHQDYGCLSLNVI